MSTITPTQFAHELDQMQEYLESGAVFPEIKGEVNEVLFKAWGDNFRNSKEAEGAAWPPRKDSKTHPLLILTGELFQSVTSSAGKDHLELVSDRSMAVGTELDYAATHENGSQKRNIPPRPFIGIGEQYEQELDGIIEGRVYEGLLRARGG